MGLPFGLGDLDLKQFGTRLESADKTMAKLDGNVVTLSGDVKALTLAINGLADQLRRHANAMDDAMREARNRS